MDDVQIDENVSKFDADDFKNYLRENTTLLEGSIQVYARAIARYFKEYDTVSIENINQFLTRLMREKNIYYVQFAFKHFLEYDRKPSWYRKTVHVQNPPRKRLRKYTDNEHILQIIAAIKTEKYRDVATLQYSTGARARGILSLHSEKIDATQSPIYMVLTEKRNKEKQTWVNPNLKPLLEKYMAGGGYLFIGVSENATPEEIDKKIQNERTYYYREVHKAALTVAGLPHFGTHDFRAHVADFIYKKTGSIRTTQKVMGHVNINTTARYFDENIEQAKKAIIEHQQERIV